MVAFLRTLTAASALPAVLPIAAASASASASASAATSNSSSSASTSTSNTVKPYHLLAFPFSFPSSTRLQCFASSRNLKSRPPQSALQMDSLTAKLKQEEQKDGSLPELLTEFMVYMKCDGCVSTVKDKLYKLDGVKKVDVDLGNQVVRVLGSLPVKSVLDALEQTGRKARLIGQGIPDDFLVSAAVAEFKGPTIFGVVLLAQVSMELARIEASFTGLLAGKHGWSINEFGDLTKGPASTGKIFNPASKGTSGEPVGDLGTLEAQENGEAQFSGAKQMLKVADLIGRSIVLYETENKSDPGIAAAVIARSAGVGENYKKLCTCDGVTIWESS